VSVVRVRASLRFTVSQRVKVRGRVRVGLVLEFELPRCDDT